MLALASHAGRISTYPGVSAGSVLLARHGKEMHKLQSQVVTPIRAVSIHSDAQRTCRTVPSAASKQGQSLSLLSFPQGGRDGCLGSEAAQSETGKPALFRDRNCFKGYLAVGKTTRAELVLTMAIAVQRTRDMVHRMLIWPTVVTTGSAEGGRNMLTVRSRCPGNKLHTVLRP